MVDRIDMSLDDIIKKDRIRPGRAGRGNKFAGRAKPGGATRAAGGSRVAAGGRRPAAVKPAGAKRTVVKKVAAGRKTVKTKAPLVRKSATNTVRRNNNVTGSSTWKNDKFSTTVPADLRSSVLEITNLHYNVSDGDLKELFREFGVIKKVTVLYDASGRSIGKAEISFATVTAANNAMKKYNGVSLDGRAMTIIPKVSNIVKASIASRLGKPNAVQPKSNNVRPKASNTFRRQGTAGNSAGRSQGSVRGQSSNRGGRGGARGGGRGGNRNNRSPRKEVTREELDADLESYIQRS